MVRNYKRKTNRQSWEESDMKNALEEVISRRMGYQRAANVFNVPQSTLEDRAKKVKGGMSIEDASLKGVFTNNNIFKF